LYALVAVLAVSAQSNPRVVAGIAPHHMPVVSSLLEEFYDKIGPAETFVVMGPRHDDKIQAHVISTDTGPGVNREIIKKLVASGLVKIDNRGFDGEHSTSVQIEIINRKYPKAKVVPLLFRSDTNQDETAKLAELLYQMLGGNSVVIASVDLSHYLPLNQTVVKDKKTISKLLSLDDEEIEYGEVDSRPAVLTLLKYARKSGAREGQLIKYSNTAVQTLHLAKEFTGYATLFFQADPNIEIQAVGDIMLSRGVGQVMEKTDQWDWPFILAKDYLRRADLLLGNLEGPLSNRGKRRPGLYVFRANPKSIKGLKNSGFTLLSLANNHSGDYGEEAYRDTQLRLEEGGLDWVGYDLDEGKYIFRTYLVKGQKIAVGGYSEISNISIPDKVKTRDRFIEEIERLNKDGYLIIILIHFGEEYKQQSNDKQKAMAHSLVDAGANIIIGSHPHVVQEIERYQEGYIFYSLGNFIFDQTFSERTQKGWIIKIIIKDGKIREATPINAYISKSFQVKIDKF